MMRIAYCTIASADDLSRVQVLEQSLRRYHPGVEFHILLCEWPEVCKKVAASAGRQFLSPADIGCADWLSMAFYYDITEYNTALKPFLLETLLTQGYEAVIYLDPDIEVYGNLDDLPRLLRKYDAILTPHVCQPVPDDGKKPTMDQYIRAGQFNLGFIGISGSPEVRELLHWWQCVLVDRCLSDENSRFFVDQFWAAAIPSLLEKTFILRDPAYNMAYWNVFQRKLDYADGKWITDGGELKFFHFSGLSRDNLSQVSVHQNRVTAPVGSPLHKFLTQYFEKIQRQEWASFNDHIYSFARYNNGEPITNDERKAFLSMRRAERDGVGNPFDANGLPKNIVRIQCKPTLERNNDMSSKRVNLLNRRVEELEKLNAAMLTSLSWRVTAPLRRLHTLVTGRK